MAVKTNVLAAVAGAVLLGGFLGACLPTGAAPEAAKAGGKTQGKAAADPAGR